MTDELTKTFFDTFGIEPKHIFRGCKLGAKYYAEICDETTCNGCDEEIRKTEYPTITDRILLELICIDNQENIYKCRPSVDNVEDLKTYILEEFIRLSKLGLFKRAHQVRTLFEEG